MKDKYITNLLKNREFRIKLYIFITILTMLRPLLIALGLIIFIIALIFSF
ncbi:MAG: hypothetical protein LRZ92_00925 [Methanosarcinaceae archaeon]|nr:hypothetical protein [Methanosarcinaceae archaeon]NKQ39451.1 hypothetical protein [Methanosarcinales archaeon]